MAKKELIGEELIDQCKATLEKAYGSIVSSMQATDSVAAAAALLAHDDARRIRQELAKMNERLERIERGSEEP